jgi:Sulfatase-modifying factor enzyme 1
MYLFTKLLVLTLLNFSIFALICLGDDTGEIIQTNIVDSSDCGCAGTSRPAGQTELKDTPTSYESSGGAHKRPNNRMAKIHGGTFTMGTNNPIILADGEGPARPVTLREFWMDVYEVSNKDFESFVLSTEYVTEVTMN